MASTVRGEPCRRCVIPPCPSNAFKCGTCVRRRACGCLGVIFAVEFVLQGHSTQFRDLKSVNIFRCTNGGRWGHKAAWWSACIAVDKGDHPSCTTQRDCEQFPIFNGTFSKLITHNTALKPECGQRRPKAPRQWTGRIC